MLNHIINSNAKSVPNHKISSSLRLDIIFILVEDPFKRDAGNTVLNTEPNSFSCFLSIKWSMKQLLGTTVMRLDDCKEICMAPLYGEKPAESVLLYVLKI